ncbi:MAG: hypothetical protein NZ583_01125 [Desulfobacterota bacterium]|nr:hypothetical protein [Thermodesulfobacteriota bacterium]MDW8001316.1 hypothetical protein [Deltaproteobacteria bacterium]
MNPFVVMILSLAVFGIAYLFVVILPLAGVFVGLSKFALREEVKPVFANLEGVRFEEALGFTMADGGEPKS